jgi:protocatechuate 3,4-dioxygenase beta subunit
MGKFHSTPIFIFLAVIISSSLAGSIEGLVSDAETGDPIAGVQITALGFTSEFADSFFYTAVSNEHGKYVMENIKAGSYVVWCDHPEYQYKKIANIAIQEQSQLQLDFQLQRKFPEYHTLVAGRVFSQPPLLPAFIPLPGATVFLENENVQLQTESDENGFYLFANVPTGKYLLSAEAPGHLRAENIDTIRVEDGTKINNLDIYLTPGEQYPFSSLSGTVFDNNDQNPVYPAYITLIPRHHYFSEGPLPIRDSLEISVKNNPDGSYLIEKIPAGVYIVMCTSPEYITERYREITLYASEINLNFYLKPLDATQMNLLSGFIYDAENEAPLVLVNVSLYSLDGPENYIQTFTDGSGYYQFHSIYPGKYVITFFKYEYYPARDTIAIEENSWITDYNVYLKPHSVGEPITVWGHVWEESPISSAIKPVYPAKIKIIGINSVGDSISYSTQNNPDGSYKISNIRPGYYTMLCSADGYETAVYRQIHLYLPEHRTNFLLKPIIVPEHGHITGRVYFDDFADNSYDDIYKPVRGALITFISPNRIYYHTYSNEQGEYKARLPVGKYIVSCLYHSPDSLYHYQEFYDDVHSIADATPVPVYPDEITDEINFGIPVPAVVSKVIFSGRVTDSEGEPLEKALVCIREIHRRNSWTPCNAYSIYTDEQGFYKIKIEYYWITATSSPIPYIVSAVKRGYKIEFYKEKASYHEADVLWAYTDTTFSNINFTLDPINFPNSISGKISNENGQPLGNAFVIGSAASSGELVFAFSNNLGEYCLDNLKYDYYYLLFVANGHIPEFYNDVREWEEATPVLASGQVTGIDAVLTPIISIFDSSGAILAGTIVDDFGNPLSGVLVSIANSEGVVTAFDFTDADGSYEIDWVPDGRHLVSVSKVSYQSENTWMDFNPEVSRVNVLDFALSQTTTSLPEGNGSQMSIPTTVLLLANYPNPFNPITHIQFSLPEAQQTRIVIYDILGRQIRELADNFYQAGYHTISWDGTDESDRVVSSGIYFYVLETTDLKLTRKMILSR